MMYNYAVDTMFIQTRVSLSHFYIAESLFGLFNRISHSHWGVFYKHPRKHLWVRRSKCNRYQQKIRGLADVRFACTLYCEPFEGVMV